MQESMTAISELFKLNTNLFETVLEGVPGDLQYTRPTDKANSVNWVAGHLARYRFALTAMLGLEVESPWGDLYRKGTGAEDTTEYPSLDEIKAVWKEISARMLKGLEEATEDQLTKEPPWTKPGMENTIRGTITFLAFHESYHLGQLGYLRKLHGLERAFG